jgi:hypothetical protein
LKKKRPTLKATQSFLWLRLHHKNEIANFDEGQIGENQSASTLSSTGDNICCDEMKPITWPKRELNKRSDLRIHPSAPTSPLSDSPDTFSPEPPLPGAL